MITPFLTLCSPLASFLQFSSLRFMTFDSLLLHVTCTAYLFHAVAILTTLIGNFIHASFWLQILQCP